MRMFARLRTPALLLMLPLTLAGCTTTTGTGGTSITGDLIVACQGFEPIRWSSRDTPTTIRNAKLHNAAYDALCKGLRGN
ncbi:MAG: hypothetical protein AAF737_04730 [Pseudomonadota bacterium]